MLEALFKYEFLQNAVIISVLASIMCAVTGVICTERKSVMLSGGIAHTAYGGVGLGYLLGFEPIIGAAFFAVAAAFLIGYISRRSKGNSDTATALLWSFGMALGIAFIGLMPGYPPDINSYLFGNILSVTHTDIFLAIPLAAAMLIIITVFFRDWQSFLFDREFAEISGLHTSLMENVLLIMTALTIVLLIKATGIILVIALLSAPASSAAFITKSLKARMIAAFLFGVFFCFTGIFISYELSISSGAAIVFTSVITYFLIMFLSKRKKIKQQRN